MKFEYLILNPVKIMTLKESLSDQRDVLLVAELNRLGDQGWEAVNIDRDRNYLLKRIKEV